MTEIIHTDHKKNTVENAGYQYPFPKLMFFYKFMSLKIGLYSYNDFFKQRFLYLGTRK